MECNDKDKIQTKFTKHINKEVRLKDKVEKCNNDNQTTTKSGRRSWTRKLTIPKLRRSTMRA